MEAVHGFARFRTEAILHDDLDEAGEVGLVDYDSKGHSESRRVLRGILDNFVQLLEEKRKGRGLQGCRA